MTRKTTPFYATRETITTVRSIFPTVRQKAIIVNLGFAQLILAFCTKGTGASFRTSRTVFCCRNSGARPLMTSTTSSCRNGSQSWTARRPSARPFSWCCGPCSFLTEREVAKAPSKRLPNFRMNSCQIAERTIAKFPNEHLPNRRFNAMLQIRRRGKWRSYINHALQTTSFPAD